MAFVTKEMTGSMFPETEKKAENPKYPDFTGKIMVHGKLIKVSAWLNEDGRFSLKLTDWVEKEPEQTEDDADASLFRKPRA